MTDSQMVRDLLHRLQAATPEERDLAAAELGDLFEADYLKQREFVKAIPLLMQAAFKELDPDAKESMFNALSSAAMDDNAKLVTWEPIAEHIKELAPNCLEHALVILSFTGDRKYRPVIEPFLRHPNQDVQRDAREALHLLDSWQTKRRTGTGTR